MLDLALAVVAVGLMVSASMVASAVVVARAFGGLRDVLAEQISEGHGTVKIGQSRFDLPAPAVAEVGGASHRPRAVEQLPPDVIAKSVRNPPKLPG